MDLSKGCVECGDSNNPYYVFVCIHVETAQAPCFELDLSSTLEGWAQCAQCAAVYNSKNTRQAARTCFKRICKSCFDKKI
jgi:hypothetical protein